MHSMSKKSGEQKTSGEGCEGEETPAQSNSRNAGGTVSVNQTPLSEM